MLSTLVPDLTLHYSLPEVQFACVNLSSRCLVAISSLPTKLLFISQLNLDNNLLQNLEGIEQFMNLEVLSVNFNFIYRKEELLRIKNIFLLKTLSFIGNNIEMEVSKQWLISQGFRSLQTINQVGNIGKSPFKANSYENYSDQHNYKQQISASRKIFQHNTKQQVQTNPMKQYYQQHQIGKFGTIQNDQHKDQIPFQTKRNARSQLSQRSGLKQNQNNLLMTNTKTKFLSNGYFDKQAWTRASVKSNKSIQELMQTKRNRSSNNSGFSTSQQRKDVYKWNHYQFLSRNEMGFDKLRDDRLRVSPQGNKVNQFRLYPVNEQSNYTSQNDDIKLSTQSARFTTIKSDKYKHHQYQLHKVHPFEQTKQTNTYFDDEFNYNPYLSRANSIQNKNIRGTRGYSDFYSKLDNSEKYKISRRQLHQTKQPIQRQLDHSHAFKIAKQIPVYKQAIAIAFYYRNLLEKVFRGFQTLNETQSKPQKIPQAGLNKDMESFQDRQVSTINEQKIPKRLIDREYFPTPQKQIKPNKPVYDHNVTLQVVK